MTRRALIFTEGGSEWGLGHLHRCAAYAEELTASGWEIAWRVHGDSLAQAFLAGRPSALGAWFARPDPLEGLAGADLAIIDSYHAPLEAYQAIADRVPRCLYIDDEARLAYPKGWVVNGVPGAETLPYALGPDTRLLPGPRYHAMRSEFRDGGARDIRAGIGNILVVMGGTDLRGLGPLAAEAARSVFPAAELRIIAPQRMPPENQARLESVKAGALGNQSAAEMRGHMEWADLCVSAAGQTLFELCRMGLPTIAVGVAENQGMNVSGFQQAHAVLFAGWWTEPSLRILLKEKIRAARDPALRLSLSQAGMALVDGLGVPRVLREMGAHPLRS